MNPLPRQSSRRGTSRTFHFGKLHVTVWTRSLPWLIQYGRRTWWLFDRGQNRA